MNNASDTRQPGNPTEQENPDWKTARSHIGIYTYPQERRAFKYGLQPWRSSGRENINSEAQSEFVPPPPPTRFYLRRGGPHGHELVIESPFRWTDLSANDLKNKPNLGYASYFPGGVYFFEPGKVDKERSRLKAAGQNHTIYDYNYEFPRKRTLKELKKSTWTIRQCVS